MRHHRRDMTLVTRLAVADGDALQSVEDPTTGVVLALVADVCLDPVQITCAEAHDTLSCWPLQQLPMSP